MIGKGIKGKQFCFVEAKIAINADGTAISSGDDITFPITFTNTPAVCVVPLLGTVRLDSNPCQDQYWICTSVTTTGCTITFADTPFDSVYWDQTIDVGVFAHEQL